MTSKLTQHSTLNPDLTKRDTIAVASPHHHRHHRPRRGRNPTHSNRLTKPNQTKTWRKKTRRQTQSEHERNMLVSLSLSRGIKYKRRARLLRKSTLLPKSLFLVQTAKPVAHTYPRLFVGGTTTNQRRNAIIKTLTLLPCFGHMRKKRDDDDGDWSFYAGFGIEFNSKRLRESFVSECGSLDGSRKVGYKHHSRKLEATIARWGASNSLATPCRLKSATSKECTQLKVWAVVSIILHHCLYYEGKILI